VGWSDSEVGRSRVGRPDLGRDAEAVTALVQEWVNTPATNFGLLLNSDPSKLRDRYRVFASLEEPDASKHPYLRITYAAPQQTYCAPAF
jgi:hypothetical protein